MSEHPVLIPTSQGPAGGIVCEPTGTARAALIFFHTGGHSGRSGFNSEWAVLSRRLALLGVTVLRLDLSTEADSLMVAEEVYPGSGPTDERIAADSQLVRDVGEWFHGRVAAKDLIATGACYGCRLVLRLASSYAGVSTMLMVVPYFRRNTEEARGQWKERMLRVKRNQSTDDLDEREPGGLDSIDPEVVEELEVSLGRGPGWILVGERDVTTDALALRSAFGDRGLDVDIEPGEGLYPGDGPPTQELVGDRIVDRVSRYLESGR